jgi:PAS domain S-box-containing protein
VAIAAQVTKPSVPPALRKAAKAAKPPLRKRHRQPPSHTATLLIVDDDEDEMAVLCEMMQATGYTATCFTSAEAALAALREQPFDLVLADLAMRGMDGSAFLRAAREIEPDLVGILMVTQNVAHAAVQALRINVQDFVIKPFSPDAVLPILGRALNVRRLRMKNVHLEQAVAIYGLSMAIQLTLGCDSVLQKVADAALGYKQVSGVAVLVPIEEGKALRVAATRGEYAARHIDGARIAFGRGLSNWVKRRSISVPELPGSVSIPMLAGGALVGILNFAPKNPARPISPGQIKALNILANAGAAALTSAALFERTRTAEARYRSLAESAADIIFRYELDPQTHLAYVNPAVVSVLGYTPAELYGDPELVHDILHPDDQELYEKILSGGFSSGSTATFRCIHRNGSTVWIEQRSNLVRGAEGRLLAVEGIARDVTERRLLEDQLRQSQKMEAIGLLAGGVAHDFNNLLTVILGYSDLIMAVDKPPASVAEKLDQVKKAGLQAASLTRQLLAFGRRQLVQLNILNINSLVANSSKILRRTIGEHIELITKLDNDLGVIKADEGQVEQILMNLAVNARDAMPQGGTLTIETKNVTVDECSPGESLAGHPGPHVMLAVSDSGAGMEALTIARIFEPFYTTKKSGEGTGLGLSIIYGIVKQAAGHIRVYSEPGNGTRFEILFPRTFELEKRRDLTPVRAPLPAGSETILVVEDDEGVRQLVTAALKQGGYEVMIAREGNEALRICERDGGKIGLVLTDFVMPGMSGRALVESLRKLNPAVRVLCMSGYASDALAAAGKLDPDVPFIHKPFTPLDLNVKIRDVLKSSVGEFATMQAKN